MTPFPLSVRLYSRDSESDSAARCRLLHEFAERVDQVRITDTLSLGDSLKGFSPGLVLLDCLPQVAENLLADIHGLELPVVVVLLLSDPDEQGHAFMNRVATLGLQSVESTAVLNDRTAVARILATATGRLRQIGQFENYRTLIEQTQDVITVVDAAGIIKYESPSLKTVLGYDPAELVGKNPFPLIHPDDRDAMLALFNKERSAVGRTQSVAYRFKHADGSWVQLESRAKVFEFSNGDSGAVISSRDVSERNAAMDQLRSREKQLEEAEQLTHIGSWRWDPASSSLEWSSEMYRIYGFDPGSPLSMDRFKEAIHPDDRDRVADVVSRCLENRQPFVMVHRIIRPDGEERMLEGRGEYRPGKQEKGDVLVGTGRDITEQVTSRRALERSERRFRSLFESSPDGILVLDEEGNVQDANGSALTIVGLSKQDLIGQRFTAVWEESDPFTPEMVRNVLSGNVNRLTKKISLEGRVRHIEITIGSLVEEDHRQSTLFLRDVSDRVESEDMLRRLGRHQQDLLEQERKRISREVHDVIGQALTSLKMDTEWAASHLEDGKTQDRLEAMADKITDTINTARRIAHELRPGILDDFGLGAAVEWYAKKVGERSGLNIKLGTIDHVELPDELQLTIFRISQELLTNVVRHAEASEVIIGMTKAGRNLTLSVSDDGRGLSGERHTEGLSLGMMGIKERLSPWKGRLELESQNGNGTKAEIIIPLEVMESGREE